VKKLRITIGAAALHLKVPQATHRAECSETDELYSAPHYAVDSMPILERGSVITLSLNHLLSHSRLLGVKASSRFAFEFEAPLNLVW
jgi:hypothetical protein